MLRGLLLRAAIVTSVMVSSLAASESEEMVRVMREAREEWYDALTFRCHFVHKVGTAASVEAGLRGEIDCQQRSETDTGHYVASGEFHKRGSLLRVKYDYGHAEIQVSQSTAPAGVSAAGRIVTHSSYDAGGNGVVDAAYWGPTHGNSSNQLEVIRNKDARVSKICGSRACNAFQSPLNPIGNCHDPIELVPGDRSVGESPVDVRLEQLEQDRLRVTCTPSGSDNKK